MKIKVSIQVEKREGFVLTQEIEVELSEETVNEVAKQIYAAQQTLALDAAMPPSAKRLSGLESVPAVEFDTQPRK